jgi:predicted extracellular nuclease
MSAVYHDLSAGDLQQDWSDAGLITSDDDWDGVPSIVGYRGDGLASTNTDARTITANDAAPVIDVTANQTNPSTFSTGGIAEFAIANPVVALQGSGTADAPYLQLHLNTTGRQNVTVSFNARDIDSGSDVVQQLNVQYRVGDTGVWTNVTGGYDADVTSAGATEVTAFNLTLPSDADNQAKVQVRIMTVDTTGSDEFVGIDDILVSSEPQNNEQTSVRIGDASIVEGDDGQQFLSFTITRSDNEGAFSLTVDTIDGTALSGSDFEALVGEPIAFEVGGDLQQTIQVAINGDTTFEPDETFTVKLSALVNETGDAVIVDEDGVGTITNDDIQIRRIFEIQGDASRSPLVGQTVTTRGIVTAIDAVGTENGGNNPRGFYVQDATGDGDYRTSDAVFVFLGTGAGSIPAGIEIGAEVQFTATVSEFTSGQQLPVTQLNPTSGYTILSTDNDLPEAVRIGAVNDLVTGLQRRPELEDLGDADADLTPEEAGVYDPVNQGADFWESLEGMRVTLEDVRVTSPFRSAFDEQFVTPNVGANPSENDRGGLTISDLTPGVDQPADKAFDFNPERIQLDDEAGIALLDGLETGDRLGDVTGVVNYANGQYEVNVTEAYGPVTKANNEREVTSIEANLDRIRVATFNAENLAPVGQPVDGVPTPQSKFDALADAIIDNLKSPEIIGLQEVLDDDGATNSSVVSATETLSQLIDAIVARGGPRYVAIDSLPVDDTVGGIPGGNQRVAYLYLADAVTPTERNNLTVEATDANGDPKVLRAPTASQIGQGDTDFTATRKSLPIEWRPAGYTDAQGGTFTTVNNHLSSKGGSQPLYSQYLDLPLYTDPLNGSAQAVGSSNEREGQAEAINAYIDALLSDGQAFNDKAVVLGDLNDFQFFPVVDLITGALVRTQANPDGTPSQFAVSTAVLAELIEKLPVAERYSYNFDGNAQALDHILVSTSLYDSALFDIVHINSEFAEQVSDHDPSVSSLRFLRSDAIATAGDDRIDQAAFDAVFDAARADLTGDDTIDGKAGEDVLFGYAGADTLLGGADDDVLVGGEGNDVLNGQGGRDTVSFAGVRVGVTATLTTTLAQDTGDGLDVFVGIENVVGGAFNDTLEGDEGENILRGANGDDLLQGRAGADTLSGVDGSDTLEGGLGDDFLYGGEGGDELDGGEGRDRLRGEAGADTIRGGAEADLLYGGLGADTFDFDLASDSGPSARDRVFDFRVGQGDLIDLIGIDAVTGGADDAFQVVTRFSGDPAGELRIVKNAAGVTIVQGHVDSDGVLDFVLLIDTPDVVSASSFVL